eukprot:m.35881 g.35881  ORF g.35881 m.35881 type:complete len:52 (-) comp11201_c0_seq2:26-181(-)
MASQPLLIDLSSLPDLIGDRVLDESDDLDLCRLLHSPGRRDDSADELETHR